SDRTVSMSRKAPAFVVGIDLGTSSCKVGIFDHGGGQQGFGQAAYSIVRGPDGQAEQRPDDWWQSVCQAVRLALQSGHVPGDGVAAVGLSGQVGTHLLLDREGQPVRPALSWQDTRARSEATALHQRIGRERLASALGIDLPPGPAWPLPRLLWLRRHAPQHLAQTWRILQVKDFVAFRLTGELATDSSSWRGLVRLPGSEVAADLLQELDLPLDLLPPRQLPCATIGGVSQTAAEACGLAAGTPVVTGWNDLNCGLLGTGVVRPAMGFDIGGTSEHLGVALSADTPLQPADNLMLAPYLSEDRHGAARVCYGVTSASGGALDWYANQFVTDLLKSHGLSLPPDSHARLEAIAASAPPGAAGLVFLPYIHGERAPIWDAAARGVFFGISSTHRHRHFVRAVLEGVAFSLRQVLQVVETAIGAPVDRVYASGGPAGLPLWNQIKANVLNRPLVIPRVTHAACLGAAMLAAIGSGWYADAVQAAEAMVHIAQQVEPDTRYAARYDALFSLYASLYPQLRTAYARLAAISANEGFSE
ncbi:MAG: xylulokinase, partial [Anaerolineales bacterium]